MKTEEKTEEKKQMTQEEIDKKLLEYRKKVYASKLVITKVSGLFKPRKTQVVLTADDNLMYTFKLEKDLSIKEEDKELCMDLVVEKSETVTKAEFGKLCPKIFKDIAKLIKEKKKAEVYLSYFQSALCFDGEFVIYRTLNRKDMETVYCKDIHGENDDLLAQQIEAKNKAEERKEGENIDL